MILQNYKIDVTLDVMNIVTIFYELEVLILSKSSKNIITNLLSLVHNI